ncbi:IclR family transcriptional regulator [Paracoccus sp. J55]|uniref:IclR family transcriptional regulator n=1 Tax=Paracoccus sp. J55 TaxID=935849 RepID=UPI0004AC8B64|nr:IclR family transcriptional regulator [Paracoccus sp. J55]
MSHIPAERCLSIIQLLSEDAAELPLGTIAETLDLPKSGTHRLLGALIEQGWAQQDPQTGYYRLTMRLAILGQRFYVATGIPDICQPLLDQLAATSGEYVRLAVVDSNQLVWVAHAQGARGGLMYQPALQSDTVPLHATASGKIWLSTLPVEEAVQIVLNSRAFQTPETYGPDVARSIEQVMEKLRVTGERGYGIARNEAEQGVSAMAAVVRAGEDGCVAGTVSIAGPSARLTEGRIEDLVPALKAAAQEISNLWPARLRRDPPKDPVPLQRLVPERRLNGGNS